MRRWSTETPVVRRAWRSSVRVERVDADGLRLWSTVDRPVNVFFGDQRVWSLWLRRDTTPVGALGVRRHAEWPRPLQRFLDGRTEASVRDAASGDELWAGPLSFGDSDVEIRVVNRDGATLGMDKSGKLVPTFGTRSQTDIDGLVAATVEVLTVLRKGGVEPFVAYGTLLGAVREGRVLGHDSDADVAYVSDHTTPVDVCRESFRLQRVVHEMGYETHRYSGAAFRVAVREGDGHVRGLDVFGGFLDEDRLYLMGEVGVDFRPEWLRPLGTARLEGVDVPVPARPEKMLEAMYGAGWQVPDPAFVFTTPRRTVRALNDWFRGLTPDQNQWERHFAIRRDKDLRARPSRLARVAADEARARGAEVLDVGAGRGSDAVWLARQGLSVTAYDFVPRALEQAVGLAEAEGLPLEVRSLSLAQIRSVLGEGARLGHAPQPRPRVVLARHVLDATDAHGRAMFARFCSMALRRGGVVVAELRPGGAEEPTDRPRRSVDPDTVVAQWRAAGARDVTVQTVERSAGAAPAVRLVGEWPS